MKIRKKLQIISVFSITAVLAIGLALSLLSRRLEQESAEAALSDRGIEDMTELGNLAFEYIHYRNARAKRQWQIKYRRISEQLVEERYEYPEEKAIIASLREDFESAGRSFINLVELRERGNSDAGDRALAQEREALLINSYLSQSLAAVTGSFELSRMIREEEKRFHELFHLLIMIATAVIAAGTLAIAFILGRSVSKPIARLHEGAEIIGTGNLNFKVGTDAKDEIGQLSRAFDRMTENLKFVTVTRDEYQRFVDNPFVGIYKSNLKGEILFSNVALARIYEYESPEELMSGGALARYKYPEKRKELIDVLMRNGKVENFEAEMITKTETIKHVLFNAILDGDVLSGFAMDITERNKAEAMLKKIMLDLERSNRELEQRLNEIKTLRGMLPICSYCKKIRDDQGYWNQIESYVTDHTEALFSHGICPACAEKVHAEMEEFKKRRNNDGR